MGSALLLAFLDKREESQTDFAKRAGVSAQALNDWVKGRRGPDITSAVAIKNATDGAVPVESWARTDGRRHEPPKRVRRTAKKQPPKQAS
jgi:DNA-binding transcriptional regulator YdaS (Cro superfamily)